MLAVADGLDNTFAGLKKKKKKQVSFGCGNYLIRIGCIYCKKICGGWYNIVLASVGGGCIK